MSIEDNKALVLSYMEHFGAGRFEEAMALLADDATWWLPGDPEKFPLAGKLSKAEYAQQLMGFADIIPNGLTLTVTGVTAEGDRVAIEATSYGETASGKIYDNTYHLLYEVRDGQIQAGREYLDTLHANEVLCSP